MLNRSLQVDYRVMSIPMFYVFKDGQPVNRAVGAQGKEELMEMLG